MGDNSARFPTDLCKKKIKKIKIKIQGLKLVHACTNTHTRKVNGHQFPKHKLCDLSFNSLT